MAENDSVSYTVMGAHQFRGCHPETCVCLTDYVLVKKTKLSLFPYREIKEFVLNVDNYEKGEDLIKILTNGI